VGIVVVQVNACRRKDVAAGEAEEDRLRKRANRALWTGWQVRDVKRVDHGDRDTPPA
jgi:hypothetical protein